MGLPWWHNGKESARYYRRRGFDPSVRSITLELEMATHSSLHAWEIIQSMGLQESDTT